MIGLKTSLAKLGFLAVLITIVVSFTFLPASNSWVPTIIAQNQQTIQIRGVPTPIILKTNTTQYVIIVPPDWASNTNLTQFAEWKTTRGIPTTIINTTYIYNNYPGEDNATKIRSFLKHAYDAWNIHWVLLVGNTNIIPMRYFWTGSGYPVPSDYYYAALNGTFDSNGNGKYGEFGEIDWTPELYVGRLPASTESELNAMINKTLTYERDIGNLAGAWMRTAVFAGGQISQTQDIQGWRIKNYIRETVISTELNITFTSLFYDSNRGYNNLTLTNFKNAINSGCAIVNLCSHGSTSTVTRSESGVNYYTTGAASSASNGYKLPLVFASACSTAHLDGTGDCLGEAMLKNSNGGAVSYIGATRTSFGGDDISDLSDSLLDALFFEALLQTGNALFSQRPGYALYQSKHQYYKTVGIVSMSQDYRYRQEFLEYVLLGDPELPIWTSIPQNLSIILPESTLVPGKLMQIAVQNSHGSPVAGVLVCIRGANYYHTYLTDTQGRISIPAPPTGSYNITVSKPNHLYNTTMLSVGSTTDQPTTFNIEAPTKISPGDRFMVRVSCSDPQGVGWLEVIVTDYHKTLVNSTVPLQGNSCIMVVDSSYFDNHSVVLYARAADSLGHLTISDAQTVHVQNPETSPLILALGVIYTEYPYQKVFWVSIPFLICAAVILYAWPSGKEAPSDEP